MASYERVPQMNTGLLIRQLIDNLSCLLDRQVDLAKLEARETVKETARGAGTLVVGAVLGLIALVSLVVTGIFALSLIMPGWLGALIAFVVFAIAAAIAFFVGRNELQAVLKHPLVRTRETIQEDLTWARHHLKSSER